MCCKVVHLILGVVKHQGYNWTVYNNGQNFLKIAVGQKNLYNLKQAYLPGVEVNHDQEGGSSRWRPFHCTSDGLKPTITPNVGNWNAQFLAVGG